MFQSFCELSQDLLIVLALGLEHTYVFDRDIPVFLHFDIEIMKILLNLLFKTQSDSQIMLDSLCLGKGTQLIDDHHNTLDKIFIVFFDSLFVLSAFVLGQVIEVD